MNKVCFIHRGGKEMASYRYRASIPVQALNNKGWEASINEGKAEIVVFSKPCQEDLELAQKICGKAKIVVDICDNHFENPIFTEK